MEPLPPMLHTHELPEAPDLPYRLTRDGSDGESAR